jgi:hypothetical protein
VTSNGEPRDGVSAWSAQQVADLHAGVLGPAEDARMRAVIAADPEAARVLTALERTREELAADPAPPLPPHVAARIEGALVRARQERPRTDHPAAGGPSGPRRRSVGRRVLVAAAVVALAGIGGAVGAGLMGSVPAPGPPPVTALPPVGSPRPPEPDRPELGSADVPAAFRAGLGRSDYGGLEEPRRLRSCLDAHGVAAGTAPVGARRVTFDGVPSLVLVLPTGVAARFRVLVVGEGCSAAVPLTRADTVVGR